MPGNVCVVCGYTTAKDPGVSMYRFPQDKTKRLRWLKALALNDDNVGSHHRVCGRQSTVGTLPTAYSMVTDTVATNVEQRRCAPGMSVSYNTREL